MVNNYLSTTFYQEHGHVTGSLSWEGWKVESIWLFSSIAIALIFVFTLLTALSSSFFCCDKTRNDDVEKTALYREGNSTQKLFFPDVPTTVYPTTHSVLQQDDNEIVEALSPAYRELPSIHPSYGNTDDSSFTTINETCNNQRPYNHSTTYPESTRSSRNIHRSPSVFPGPRDNRASDTNQLSVTTTQDITTNGSSRSQSAPRTESESDLWIRVASMHDSQACVTSSTSGVVTGYDDMTSQSLEESGSIKNAALSGGRLTSGDKSNQVKSGYYSEPVVVNEVLQDISPNDRYSHYHTAASGPSNFQPGTKHSRSNDSGFIQEDSSFERKRATSRALVNTSRLLPKAQFDESPELPPNSISRLSSMQFMERKKNHLEKKRRAGSVCEARNENEVLLEDNVNRGASSFGDGRLIFGSHRGDTKTSCYNKRATSCDDRPRPTEDRSRTDINRLLSEDKNYYSLTFQREPSLLSDNDGDPMRGASAFGGRYDDRLDARPGSAQDSRQNKENNEPYEVRGASVFGTQSKAKETHQKASSRNSFAIESCYTTKPRSPANQVAMDELSHANRSRDNGQPISDGGQQLGKRAAMSARGASELGLGESCLAANDYDSLFESVSLSFAYESPSEQE